PYGAGAGRRQRPQWPRAGPTLSGWPLRNAFAHNGRRRTDDADIGASAERQRYRHRYRLAAIAVVLAGCLNSFFTHQQGFIVRLSSKVLACAGISACMALAAGAAHGLTVYTA